MEMARTTFVSMTARSGVTCRLVTSVVLAVVVVLAVMLLMLVLLLLVLLALLVVVLLVLPRKPRPHGLPCRQHPWRPICPSRRSFRMRRRCP